MTFVSPLARQREGSGGSTGCKLAKVTVLKLTKRERSCRMMTEAVQYQSVVKRKSYLVKGRKTVETL